MLYNRRMTDVQKRSHVIAQGEFVSDQVVISTGQSNRTVNVAIEARIEELWAEQLETARQKGLQLYDSQAYRLNACQQDTGHISLELALINYKIHAAMKALHNEPNVHEEHFDKTLVADSLVKTSDNKYVFMHVRKVVEDTVYLVGGTCAESRMAIHASYDFFAFMKAKIADILNVPESAIHVSLLFGLIQNEVGCVNAIFDTQVDLSSQDIINAFVPRNGVNDLVMVDAASVKSYVAKAEGYVAAVAELLP